MIKLQAELLMTNGITEFWVGNYGFMICYIKNNFGETYQTYDCTLKHNKFI